VMVWCLSDVYRSGFGKGDIAVLVVIDRRSWMEHGISGIALEATSRIGQGTGG
jgi:hypothetical protein